MKSDVLKGCNELFCWFFGLQSDGSHIVKIDEVHTKSLAIKHTKATTHLYSITQKEAYNCDVFRPLWHQDTPSSHYHDQMEKKSVV